MGIAELDAGAGLKSTGFDLVGGVEFRDIEGDYFGVLALVEGGAEVEEFWRLLDELVVVGGWTGGRGVNVPPSLP